MILPYAAGGPTDYTSRLLASGMEKRLGQPVIVDYKPGGNTVIAAEFVARAPADGYTILYATATIVTSSILATTSYDPVRDLQPITQVSSATHVLLVNNSVPANNLKELIQWLKSNGPKVNYASVGIGSSTHIEAEAFKQLAVVEMNHVPYKGSAPAIVDLISGRVQISFDSAGSSLPYIRDGRLRALASAGPRRNRLLPSLPTMAESGLPGYEFQVWVGLFAPTGTPEPIIDRLYREARGTLTDPVIHQKLMDVTNEPVASSPAEFAAFFRKDAAQAAALLKKSNVKGE